MTRHSFSFGEHYDPERTSFGPLVCHDDHQLRGGVGFDTHRHAGLEIVSWVVSGAVAHRDSVTGSAGGGDGGDGGAPEPLVAGQAGLLRAGSGVEHAEHAVPGHGPTRFVQVWLTPDADAPAEPSYTRATPSLETGHLVPVDLPLAVAGAELSVARLDALQQLTLPAAPRLHVFVARGALLRSSLAEPLSDGDAFCFVDEPEHVVTAAVPSELLVWRLP